MDNKILNFQSGRPRGWIFFLPLAAVVALCRARIARRPFTLLLHLGLILILAGALTSRLSAREGTVHLREGEATEQSALPFYICLQSFDVEVYPGSDVHSGYRTALLVGPERKCISMSLNETAEYRGYEFIQQSFDSDGKGVVLKFTSDTFGTLITCVAYLLTLVGASSFSLSLLPFLALFLSPFPSLPRVRAAVLCSAPWIVAVSIFGSVPRLQPRGFSLLSALSLSPSPRPPPSAGSIYCFLLPRLRSRFVEGVFFPFHRSPPFLLFSPSSSSRLFPFSLLPRVRAAVLCSAP